jgi:hypothetical protein
MKGDATDPVIVAFGGAKTPPLKDIIMMTLVTILPVAIVILMQKPALRQALIMRTSHTGRTLCNQQANFWKTASRKFDTIYNQARF